MIISLGGWIIAKALSSPGLGLIPGALGKVWNEIVVIREIQEALSNRGVALLRDVRWEEVYHTVGRGEDFRDSSQLPSRAL